MNANLSQTVRRFLFPSSATICLWVNSTQVIGQGTPGKNIGRLVAEGAALEGLSVAKYIPKHVKGIGTSAVNRLVELQPFSDSNKDDE